MQLLVTCQARTADKHLFMGRLRVESSCKIGGQQYHFLVRQVLRNTHESTTGTTTPPPWVYKIRIYSLVLLYMHRGT